MCLLYNAYVTGAQERIQFTIIFCLFTAQLGVLYFPFGSQRMSHLCVRFLLSRYFRFRAHQAVPPYFQCVLFLSSQRPTSCFTWQFNYYISIHVKCESISQLELCLDTFKSPSWTLIFLFAFGKCLKGNLFQYKCRKIGTQTKPPLQKENK